MSKDGKRPRGIYCTKEEWAWVTAQAKTSGMRIGEYLVHCGLTVEVPEGGVEKPTNATALSPDELRQLLDLLTELVKSNETLFGRHQKGEPDMLGMIRVCFECARADYLDKYGSFAYDELVDEVQRDINEPGDGPVE